MGMLLISHIERMA